MNEVLILSEGAIPDSLAGSDRWPELNVRVESDLTHRDIPLRLLSMEVPDAVIVDAGAPNPALTEALARLTCMSVEIRAANPNRHADGTPDLTAVPLGADAIIYGLGEAGVETALALLTNQLSEQAG